MEKINPYYHLPQSLRDIYSGDTTFMEYDVPDSVKDNQADFSRFLFAYLEWLMVNKNPNRVDIDNIPEEFVSQLKYELAYGFPDENRILDRLEVIPVGYSDVDRFFGNNTLTTFLLSYDVRSEEVKSYDVSVIEVNGTETILTYGTDYVIRERVIYLLEDGNIFKGRPLSTDENLIIKYNLAEGAKKVSNPDVSKTINYKLFLKRIKELYLSKGTEASFKFIFNLLYKDKVFITYPKEKIFRTSSTEFKSDPCIHITKTSLYNTTEIKTIKILDTGNFFAVDSATSVGLVNNVSVQQLVLGSFDLTQRPSSNAAVEVKTADGRKFIESVLSCVSTIKIIDGGLGYAVGDHIGIRQGDAYGSAMVKSVSNGKVISVSVENGGYGYTKGEKVLFSLPADPYGTRAYATIEEVDVNGTVVKLKLQNTGSGYLVQPSYEIEEYSYKQYFNSFSMDSLKQSKYSYNLAVSMYSKESLGERFDAAFKNYVSPLFTYYKDHETEETALFRNEMSFHRALNNACLMYGVGYTLYEDNNGKLLSKLSERFWHLGSVYSFSYGVTENVDVSLYLDLMVSERISRAYYLKKKEKITTINFDLNVLEDIKEGVVESVISDFEDYVFSRDLYSLLDGADLENLVRDSYNFNIYKDVFKAIEEMVSSVSSSYDIETADLSLKDKVNGTLVRNLYASYFKSIEAVGEHSIFISGLISSLRNRETSQYTIYLDIKEYLKTDNILEYVEKDDIGFIDSANSKKSLGKDLKIKVETTVGKVNELIVTNPAYFINTNDLANVDIVDYIHGETEPSRMKIEVVYDTVWISPTKPTKLSGVTSSDSVLPDNYFYQEFSYVVNATKLIEEWAPYVKKLCHPAGMKFFGNIYLPTIKIDSSVKSHAIKYIVNIINDMTNYLGSGKSLSPVVCNRLDRVISTNYTTELGSRYRSFDRFKFEIDNENSNKYVNKYIWDRSDLVPKNKIEFITADTRADSHDFLELSVEEVERRSNMFYHPRPDSFINVYPKVYFIRSEERHIPGFMTLGSNFMTIDRNKIYGSLTAEMGLYTSPEDNSPLTIMDTSLDSMDKLKLLKVNLAMPSIIKIKKI